MRPGEANVQKLRLRTREVDRWQRLFPPPWPPRSFDDRSSVFHLALRGGGSRRGHPDRSAGEQIQAAIDLGGVGDVVVVEAGGYRENLVPGEEVVLQFYGISWIS